MHPVDPRRWRRRRRQLFVSGALAPLLFAFAFLPGCSGIPLHGGEPPSPRGGPPDDVIESWRATGKLAARTRVGSGSGGNSGRGSSSWSGSLDWRQVREEFLLRLSGPFGQGALQVEGRPGQVELTTARGERRSARTPEALFVRELGWELPASSLRHWITARAHPGIPIRAWTLDEAGRLSSLVQQGWRVEYGYRGPPHGHSLPNRITLRGEGAVVRIAIRDWRVG